MSLGILGAALLAAATPPPSVLLVTIDTLRADRVGCYGYARGDTPALDRLAREGLLLEDATVQVPQTRPSHASILTGRWPFEHGIRDNFAPALDASMPTLASHLKTRGYDTAAFIGSFVLAASSGLQRGFDTYDDPFSAAGPGSPLYQRPERRAEEVVASALQWLSRPRSRPFFAWVHLYDPHAPYDPPPAFAKKHAATPYDGEVAYADREVGRLVAFLDKQGLRNRTLVVVTSDHGEGLGDHGEDEHMLLIYDSTLRVPLIASWPGVIAPGKRASGQFRSVDLFPTVVDLVGAGAVSASGASRAAAWRDGSRIPDNESYAESLYGNIHFGYAPLRALRAEGLKFIDAPRGELFNLREDPSEAKNLFEARGSVAEKMRARLTSYGSAAKTPPRSVSADASVLERLAALGYIGGTAPRAGAPAGADPKDKIGQFQAYVRDAGKARQLAEANRWDEALPLLERLSKAETLSFEVESLRGKALLRKRRFADAASALEDALSLVPQSAETYVLLSRAYVGAKRGDDALRALDRGAALDPRNALFLREKGVLLAEGGDGRGAQAALEKARQIDPRDARTRLALSALYRDGGRAGEAVDELKAAVAADPRSGDAWNALGTLLGADGKDAEAEKAFRSGLAVDGDDPDMLFGLSILLSRRGDTAGARASLQRLVAKTPRYPGAAEALAQLGRTTEPVPPGHAWLRLWRSRDRGQLEGIAASLSAKRPAAERGENLGLVRVADLNEPLRSAAAALVPGAVSAIVQMPDGYALVARDR